MASDTQLSADLAMMGHCNKVFKIKGHLVGMAGSKWCVNAFLHWAEQNFEVDRPLPEMPHWNADGKDTNDGLWGYVVAPNGTIYRYETRGFPYVIESEYVACGSGREYAMGAMAAGSGPEAAVKIAMLFDRGSSGEIRNVSFND